MLPLMLSLLLLGAPQDPPKPPEPPSPERVEQALEELEESLEHGSVEEQVRRLTEASEVPCKEMALQLRKSLKSKSPKLVAAALQGLRWMRHPSALEVLHKAHASEKSLLRDASQHLALIKSIAQHGDKSSIRLLSQEIFAHKDGKIVQAHIYGLGMIRHKDSLEALFKLMSSNAPKKVQQHMVLLRTSLMMLTGEDKGPRMEEWQDWWREQEKGFEMQPRSKLIPRKILDHWTRYWGLDYVTERGPRREDRGR